MNALYSQLEKYQQDPSDKKTIRMLNALLNRASKFSGVTSKVHLPENGDMIVVPDLAE